MTTFGLLALTAAPDPTLSFIFVGPYVKIFDVSAAPLAHLRTGRAALHTNCGTGRATCRVPGMAPPGASNAAAAHPAAAIQPRSPEGCAGDVSPPAGGSPPAPQCRLPAARPGAGPRQYCGASGLRGPGMRLVASPCIYTTTYVSPRPV